MYYEKGIENFKAKLHEIQLAFNVESSDSNSYSVLTNVFESSFQYWLTRFSKNEYAFYKMEQKTVLSVNSFTPWGRKNHDQLKDFFLSEIYIHYIKNKNKLNNLFYDVQKNAPYGLNYYMAINGADKKDLRHILSAYNNDKPRLAPGMVFSYFRNRFTDLFNQEVENLFREKSNVPKIGQGWISETQVYNLIKTYLHEYTVIQHGKPSWLGNQHLDIYIPEIKLGIEYQGKQHFEPVEYFGGKEAHKLNLERDKRKLTLSIQNNFKIFYLEEGYDVDALLKKIDKYIKSA